MKEIETNIEDLLKDSIMTTAQEGSKKIFDAARRRKFKCEYPIGC